MSFLPGVPSLHPSLRAMQGSCPLVQLFSPPSTSREGGWGGGGGFGGRGVAIPPVEWYCGLQGPVVPAVGDALIW